MNIFDLFDRLTKLTLNTEPSSSSHVVCEGRMSHLGIINFNGYSFLLLKKYSNWYFLPVKILKLPKLLKKRMFSRSTKLPSTGALDHGGPLKGEAAERCSPNYKLQLGSNIGLIRLPVMTRNHLTVPSWTYSVVFPASNHHHSHEPHHHAGQNFSPCPPGHLQ